MASVEFIGNLRASPAWLNEFTNRDRGVQPTPYQARPRAVHRRRRRQRRRRRRRRGAGATSVPVAALTPNSILANTTLIAAGNVLIPAGTVLYFGGAKVATLTADAKIGDTALTVAALPTALVSGDTATYSATAGRRPSGTFVGRTYAERRRSPRYGPAATTDDEIFLHRVRQPGRHAQRGHRNRAAAMADDGGELPARLRRHRLLLGTSASPTALLTKLRTLFVCEQGTN
jgi:hypothetical protein